MHTHMPIHDCTTQPLHQTAPTLYNPTSPDDDTMLLAQCRLLEYWEPSRPCMLLLTTSTCRIRNGDSPHPVALLRVTPPPRGYTRLRNRFAETVQLIGCAHGTGEGVIRAPADSPRH